MGPWLQVRALQCHTNTVKLNNKLAAIAIVISTCFDLLPRTHQPQTLVRVCDHVFQLQLLAKHLQSLHTWKRGNKSEEQLSATDLITQILLGWQCFPLAVKSLSPLWFHQVPEYGSLPGKVLHCISRGEEEEG